VLNKVKLSRSRDVSLLKMFDGLRFECQGPRFTNKSR